MPYIQQDLSQDLLGSADQKHTGVTHDFNEALLSIRQTSAWLDAHFAGKEGKE